ncbi:MAG: acyloxyacyl hydrolase [Terracidiphilus sp.]
MKPGATAPANLPPARELTFVSLVSYGHYKIFASGSGAKLYTSGVEYDRNSWGRFLGARFDYVAEFLPVVLLNAAKTSDIWGTPTTQARQIVPGVGFSPIGFRLEWRDSKAIKPYLLAKGGVIIFSQKELSQQATYENFSLQSSTGLQVRMTPRVELRLGLFGDFHFSDDFIVPVNPGLDVMNASLGITYHLGHPQPVH